MMKPIHPNNSSPVVKRSQQRRRGGGFVAARIDRAEQESCGKAELRHILAGMTPANKVGQLLMAYLEPEKPVEKIVGGSELTVT